MLKIRFKLLPALILCQSLLLPAAAQSADDLRSQLSSKLDMWNSIDAEQDKLEKQLDELIENSDKSQNVEELIKVIARSDELQSDLDAAELDAVRLLNLLDENDDFNSRKKLKEVKPGKSLDGISKYAQYLKEKGVQGQDEALIGRLEAIQGQMEHGNWLRANRLQKLGAVLILRGQPRLSLQANLALRTVGPKAKGYIRNFDADSTIYDIGMSYFHSGELQKAEEIANTEPNKDGDVKNADLRKGKRVMLQAMVAEAKGNYAEAIAFAKNASSGAGFLYPHGFCYAIIARCHAKAKQPTEAIKQIEIAKILASYNPELDYARDVILAEAEYLLGRDEEAQKLINSLDQSIAKQNRYYGARLHLIKSLINTKQKKLSEAEADLNFCKGWLEELPTLDDLAKSASNALSDARGAKFPLSSPVREKFALIVGIGNFKDTTIPKLRYSAKDAIEMKDMLVQNYGFKSENVKLLTDASATKQNILEALRDDWLPKNAKADDMILVFVSSHGTPANKSVESKNYVVLHDTSKTSLYTSSISMDQICKLLRSRCNAKKLLVIADTCYSGGLAIEGDNQVNLNPDEFVVANSMLVVSSSDVNQKSWESRRYENGVFTRQLIESFKKHRNFNDFKEVFMDLQNKTAQEVKEDDKADQTPRLGGIWNAADVGKKTQ